MRKRLVATVAPLGLAAMLMAGGGGAPEARAQQDASAVEGESVKFTIARPATTDGTSFTRAIRYQYATADGTAENGDDYRQRGGYVIWNASAQNASVSVQTYEDESMKAPARPSR